jgi:hypothetical protein
MQIKFRDVQVEVRKVLVLILGLVRASGLLLRKYECSDLYFYTVETLGPTKDDLVVDWGSAGARFRRGDVDELVVAGFLKYSLGAEILTFPQIAVVSREAYELTALGLEMAEACRSCWEPEWSAYFTSRGRPDWLKVVRGCGLETALQQAEQALHVAHNANEARKNAPVFGYETYANLSSSQVEALIEELRRLRQTGTELRELDP